MNTFHTSSTQDQLFDQSEENTGILENTCENTKSAFRDVDDILQGGKYFSKKFYGFAVKLSILSQWNISLRQLLEMTTADIIIDAEFQRLDQVIDDFYHRNSDMREAIKRLVVTVQVKRADAEKQIENLQTYHKRGLRILLVAGNKAYFQDTRLYQGSVQDRFVQLSTKYNISLIGCGLGMFTRLAQSQLSLDKDNILELQGYERIQDSKVWTYYAGEVLSDRARDYLSRRGTEGQFLARSAADLAVIAKQHELVIFVDACCKYHLLHKFKVLDQTLHGK